MILYCADCSDVKTPVTADFIQYGRSLCSPCFFKKKMIDEGIRLALDDPGDRDDYPKHR